MAVFILLFVLNSVHLNTVDFLDTQISLRGNRYKYDQLTEDTGGWFAYAINVTVP